MEVRYKVMTNIFDFRLKMVYNAQQYGVSETARLFEVSRPTVYKWTRRFELEGMEDYTSICGKCSDDLYFYRTLVKSVIKLDECSLDIN